jgi:Zn-dependent peptidase ImmA (M78 family)/transcriptional regulator with XRE-family HTH domain
MALAQKLRYARERCGLTLAQVKERTGIGESSLSDFEREKREPSLSQLNALARAYRRALSFFFAEGEPPQEIILWRKRPGDPTEDIEGRFRQLCEQYHNLEMWCNETLQVRLPFYEGDSEGLNYVKAEELAGIACNALNLGGRPGPALLTVLEEVYGVKIFHLRFQPTGTAACTFDEAFGPAVLLNSENVRWRRNHDLAHELFHLLTWKTFRTAPENNVPSDKEEKLATCFAVNLLMPAHVARTAINSRLKSGRIAYTDLFDVAREFDVSVESLLWRIHFLYGKRPEDSEETSRQIESMRAAAGQFEEREKDSPPVWPARYYRLAVTALRRGDISIGRFAEYLDITRQEAMKYFEQEIPDDEEVQVTPPA